MYIYRSISYAALTRTAPCDGVGRDPGRKLGARTRNLRQIGRDPGPLDLNGPRTRTICPNQSGLDENEDVNLGPLWNLDATLWTRTGTSVSRWWHGELNLLISLLKQHKEVVLF